MKRFLLFWLVLALSLLLAYFLTARFVFHLIDLRFERFFEVVTIPVIQAIIVAWVLRPSPPRRGLAALLPLLQNPWVTAPLIAELAVLTLGWSNLEQARFGLLGEHSLHSYWVGLETALAAVAVVTLCIRHVQGRGERHWLAAYALLLLVIAAELVMPWSDRLDAWLNPHGSIYVWGFAARVALFLLCMLLLAQIAEILRRRSHGAAILFDAASLVLFLCGYIALLDSFQPHTPTAVAALIQSGLSLGATLALAGGLACVSRRGGS